MELCVNSDGDYQRTVENGVKLVKHLLDKHNLSINDVKQHHDWYPKNCPAQLRARKKGISWDDFLLMVQGKSIDAPEHKVKSATDDNNGANLTVDGYWGTKTTTALQKSLDTVVDGVISGQVHNQATDAVVSGITFGGGGSLVIETLQRKIGSTDDGLLGPNTVSALQEYLGTVVDGVISDPSLVVKALQRALNAGNL
ncbi:hypothetical protein J416_08267 [Gracilibacillus halophilus YIM-C55.5]|uniref:N-acetylmuramoyl-L-alanine amidase n=1 Tax=Gracilibacillus halophilus YIM-C55.5 TaxID=1308866 RepID=N4WL37_9BACI|nr:hypothetical protein J416_08267 [Gracilibacillus halophilus YIM-C55.5]